MPLVLRRGFFHAELRGISHEAELTTLANGKRVDRRAGSLLWTHFGVSGPVVLDASRHWVLARARGETAELRMSVLPGKTAEDADALLQSFARRRLVRCLTELVLPVERDRGWDFAEVTAGGVPLAEVDYRSMASR